MPLSRFVLYFRVIFLTCQSWKKRLCANSSCSRCMIWVPAWFYHWPFLKACAQRFYQLHEKGTSGQFKFGLKLPWYCLSFWMRYAVGELSCFLSLPFSRPSFFFCFRGNFLFCNHCFLWVSVFLPLKSLSERDSVLSTPDQFAISCIFQAHSGIL